MIDIKDKSGKVLFSTPINKGSKRKFQLMKEDYITLKFSLPQPIYFSLGDGIDNEIGMFELVDLYKPTYNAENSGYDYELRLDAYYWKWKNKKFFYIPEDGGREASWSLTETLKTHMEVFKKNLQVLGYKFRNDEFDCRIDETVEASSKPITYDNCNLIDALTQMAEAWECEWWIENSIIRFGRCEHNKDYPVDFELNKNVSSMERSDGQNKYATRVYAFGATRNIPLNYRKKLEFDVKTVNGRDISDTKRLLDEKFFPISSKQNSPIKILYTDVAGYVFYKNEKPAAVNMKAPSISLKKGTYKISVNKISVAVEASNYCKNLNGDLVFRSWMEYTSNGEKKIIDFFRFQVPTNNPPHSEQVSLTKEDVLISFVLDSDILDCVIKTETSVGFDTDEPQAVVTFLNNGSLQGYNRVMDIKQGVANSALITFISGLNEGNTYEAIVNPTFLVGDAANVIRLPEGVTASTGDRYTIDNIIKGKVPDSYFSKDDNEMTINSVVQKRLMLPADIPFIGDKDIPTEEAVEEIVVFDDVYPRSTGTILSVTPHKYKDVIKEQGKPDIIEEWNAYRFKDDSITFSEDFRLKGQELRIVFQSGKLNGMDFAVTFNPCDKEANEPLIPEKNADGSWNSDAQVWEIIRNEDYGIPLPNDTLRPYEKHIENGVEIPADTYILYGFDTAFISEKMLPKAEDELKKKAEEYIKKSKIDPSTYNCKMIASNIYNEGNTRIYELGECVNLINPAYFSDGRKSRIIGYECSLDIPYDNPVYIVGETAAYSRLGAIESKIDSLTYKGQTYSGSTAGGNGIGVYVIGLNDKTLPSDRNTFSAKRIINEITERSLSRIDDDSTSGLISFLKGLKSDNLIEANNGLVVRKQEVVELSTISLCSVEFAESIIEEGEDSIVEQLSIGGATTLGELDNVSTNADKSSETNDVLLRLAGEDEWTINTTLMSDVFQLMSKVFPFTLTLSGGGTYEKGSTQTIRLSWTYDRDIDYQSVNNESLSIDIRSKQYVGITTDISYVLRAVCNNETYSKSVFAQFRLKKYYGVSSNDSLTNEQIVALAGIWAAREQSTTAFDCTGGKYPYYILPTSMVSDIQFWIGGLRNTDWVEEVRNVTNIYGYTESYTIFRLNRIQTGVLNIEVK